MEIQRHSFLVQDLPLTATKTGDPRFTCIHTDGNDVSFHYMLFEGSAVQRTFKAFVSGTETGIDNYRLLETFGTPVGEVLNLYVSGSEY